MHDYTKTEQERQAWNDAPRHNKIKITAEDVLEFQTYSAFEDSMRAVAETADPRLQPYLTAQFHYTACCKRALDYALAKRTVANSPTNRQPALIYNIVAKVNELGAEEAAWRTRAEQFKELMRKFAP